MKIKCILVLSTLLYIFSGCSGKIESRGFSRIAILPDGKGFLAKEAFGYSKYKMCTEYYLIVEVDSNSTKPLFRMDKKGCDGHGAIDFKFNIQKDTLILIHSDSELKDSPSILRKIGNSKYPVVFVYRENLSEVAGISEHDEILLTTSKWDSILENGKNRSILDKNKWFMTHGK